MELENLINSKLVYDNSSLVQNVLLTCIIIDSTLNTNEEDIQILDKKAKDNGYVAFTHHFYVRKNGYIYTGRNLNDGGDFDVRFKRNTIGVLLEGNFNEEEMSATQLNALVNLIFYLKSTNKYISDNIFLHSEVNNESYKNSPGVLFPYVSFKNKLNSNISTTTDTTLNINQETIYELGSRNLEYKVPNMVGDDIFQLKVNLVKLGYEINEMSSTFDRSLKNTIKIFQQDNNLTVSGIVDKETCEEIKKLIELYKINHDESIKYHRVMKYTVPNMNGTDIKYIKECLYNLGYFDNSSDINDVYDIDTYNAVSKFEQSKNINVNGTVNPITYDLIINSKDYRFRRKLYLVTDGDLLEGADVEILQKALLKKGYNVVVNGFYDIITNTAVLNYQYNNNYTMTGIVTEYLYKQILN